MIITTYTVTVDIPDGFEFEERHWDELPMGGDIDSSTISFYDIESKYEAEKLERQIEIMFEDCE